MNGFFDRNLRKINLIIAACCLTFNIVTMYLLAYWTSWTDSSGAVGGILDYRFLGISTVYHVTAQGARGQALFSFPDVASYLLLALVILNSAVMVKQARTLEAAPAITTRRIAERNLVMALLCIVGYAWATMTGIDSILNSTHGGPTIGGVLQYNYPFPLFWIIFSLESGHMLGMGRAFAPDYAAWLLLIIIYLNLLPIIRAYFEAGFTFAIITWLLAQLKNPASIAAAQASTFFQAVLFLLDILLDLAFLWATWLRVHMVTLSTYVPHLTRGFDATTTLTWVVAGLTTFIMPLLFFLFGMTFLGLASSITWAVILASSYLFIIKPARQFEARARR